MQPYDLPSPELLDTQAQWLAPARARLLRRAEIARRRNVLDLGCGYGAVTHELVRRSGGQVVALDRNSDVLADPRLRSCGATLVRGDAARMPFADDAFDLVFCQYTLLWCDAPAATASEIHRVLRPGGVLAALEPDYGGMIEHPPEIALRDLWLAALARAGADPCVGRKLPSIFAKAGFKVQVDLLDRLSPPSPLRFDLLRVLPLDAAEQISLHQARQCDARQDHLSQVVHLPIFLILAEK